MRTASPSTLLRLDAAIVLVAAGAILDALFAPSWLLLHWLCKPLATALIALRLRYAVAASPRRTWLLVGLGLSWLGDVLLMWPADLFLGGLVAFLLAHLCYIRAFGLGLRWRAALPGLLLFALVAAGVLTTLLPQVPEPMRLPVLAYVAVLVLMAAVASGHSLQRGLRPWPAAALGAALFLLSDSLLALNRFHTPLPLAPLWVLASYYAAQWCLACSASHASATQPHHPSEARPHG